MWGNRVIGNQDGRGKSSISREGQALSRAVSGIREDPSDGRCSRGINGFLGRSRAAVARCRYSSNQANSACNRRNCYDKSQVKTGALLSSAGNSHSEEDSQRGVLNAGRPFGTVG